MNLSGGKILVVGLGESGRAVSRWLVGQGARVTVSEMHKQSALDKDVLDDLSKSGVTLELGGHKMRTFLETDLIVVSPGVPLDITPLVEARNRGIPILGEIELASRYIKTPFIAVTGTNGKSTVVNLIDEMLTRGEKMCLLAEISAERLLTTSRKNGQPRMWCWSSAVFNSIPLKPFPLLWP